MSQAMLLAAAKRALAVIEDDYATLLECHCLLDGDRQPLLDTLDASAEPAAREYRDTIDALTLAIAATEAGGAA